MMPAMTANERPRPREEGNVHRIPTAFETRVRRMVIWKAQREARQAVIRKLKAEGRRTSLMSAGEITQLADAHLRANAAALLAEASASGVVQQLRNSFRKKHVDPPAKSLRECHAKNGATIGPSINKDRGEQQ
jgi:hypothetical protein